MCLISNLIVIDEFTRRSEEFLYILTHWHSDHYQGIINNWIYGPIYSSQITKKIALTKYPGLADKINILPIGIWLQLDFLKKIKIYAFDSNHMAGSIMVLIKIEERFYLHTGDMRFNSRIAKNNPKIFKATGQQQYQCRYSIEQMHLDNTFCDPIFKFPTRSKALKLVIDLVTQLNPKRLFICTDTIGKEEAFIVLSKYYKVKIAVNKDRMQYIRQMNFNWESYFTLNNQSTWIQSIKKGEKDQKVTGHIGSIAVTLTGWANIDISYPDGYNSYLIPYSLHSNFREMEMLVSWVKPKKLIPIVREGNKWQNFSKKMGTYKGYVFSLSGIKQRGLQFLRSQYCLCTKDDIQFYEK